MSGIDSSAPGMHSTVKLRLEKNRSKGPATAPVQSIDKLTNFASQLIRIVAANSQRVALKHELVRNVMNADRNPEPITRTESRDDNARQDG